MNSQRIHRLLRIIALLQTGTGRSVDSLALECQVTRRTIFRDLAAIRDAGLGLQFEFKSSRYHLPVSPVGQPLPLAGFTDMEALAVIAMCNESLGSWTFPFRHALHSAALKFEHALSVRVRRRLRDLVGTLEIRPGEYSLLPGDPQVHEGLVNAIADRRAVRIHYNSVFEKRKIQTKLWPYLLFHSRHTWYVIGRSSLHRDTRTFHIGRIDRLEVLNETFSKPRGFSLQRKFGNAWRMIRGKGPDRKVRIRFQPRVAPNVAQVRWHRTQEVQHNPDGTIEFTATVSGLEEISWWILGYGDQAEVLEPAELRDLVAAHARHLLANYEAATPQADRLSTKRGPGVPAPHIPLSRPKSRERQGRQRRSR